MSISVTCPSCGLEFDVDGAAAGQTVACGACGKQLRIPASSAAVDELALMPSAAADLSHSPGAEIQTPEMARPAAAAASAAPTPVSAGATPAARPWNRRYLLLSLALIPLAWSVLQHPKEEDFEKRLAATMEHRTQAEREKVLRVIQSETATLDDLMAALPEERLKGALLARSSWQHWFYAASSAAAFLAVIVLAFPAVNTPPVSLISTGLFTGTIGIFLLLALQYIAMYSQGIWIRGSGIIAILFYIVKFIGFSYSAALDSSNGFVLSFLGFTCGVGFCEELCKALPMIKHFRTKATLDWRGACVFGLASGAGFGVSEGITYASRYYNGIAGGDIYIIRFVSCVALHAIWSAAAGITIWKKQFSIQGNMGFLELLLPLVSILAVPMILHGLYDTLLKQGMEGYALLAALGSMAWLAWQIEQAKGLEDNPDYHSKVAPWLRI